MKSVCLVTEELSVSKGAGGIGAAFLELAIVLHKTGYFVTVFYAPIETLSSDIKSEFVNRFAALDIEIKFLDQEKYVWAPFSPEKRSYAVARALMEADQAYDVIHFHDYKGLGFASQSAKRQGLAFSGTTFVVQLHGCTRWTMDANNTFYSSPTQLQIDFMERKSMAWADYVVSPSEYLIDYLNAHHFELPSPERVKVIKNASTLLVADTAKANDAVLLSERIIPHELIYFSRHENRKGFLPLCDALDRLAETLVERNIRVTFLGPLGEISGQPSGITLTERAKRWQFHVDIHPFFNRDQAVSYLRSRRNALVVIPSPVENSPYAVLEAMLCGRPVVTSRNGGAKELIHPNLHEEYLVDITSGGLASHLLGLLNTGISFPQLAEDSASVAQKWGDFHKCICDNPLRVESINLNAPKVTLAITHFERPAKLVDAVLSAVRQDYQNLDIIVVDDGSTSTFAIEQLANIERILTRYGGRVVRQENKYLGAARNTAARESKSDYILFLDDDDLAFPSLVSTLVRAAIHTGADITNCLNLFMEESRRASVTATPEIFDQKVSYVPTGGPLSLAPVINVFGAATALIRRGFFEKMGGYTEIYGVGHEDYEFFARAMQAGGRIEVVPVPLYLYEVGRPSMISTTAISRNFRRVIDHIDYRSHGAEMWDLLNMFATRSALDNEKDRLAYEGRVSLYSKEISEVLAARGNWAQMMSALSRFAMAVGANSVAAAWIRAGLELEASIKKKLEVEPLVANSENLSNLLLVMGLNPQNAEPLIEYLNAQKSLNATILQFVRQLMVGHKISKNRSAISSIYEVLRYAKVSDELRGDLLATTLILGLQSDQPGLRALFDQIIGVEDEAYVRSFDDLVAAKATGKLPSGFRHYADHGYYEGREGFKGAWLVANHLAYESSDKFYPWDIPSILRKREQQKKRRLFKLS